MTLVTATTTSTSDLLNVRTTFLLLSGVARTASSARGGSSCSGCSKGRAVPVAAAGTAEFVLARSTAFAWARRRLVVAGSVKYVTLLLASVDDKG
eukprot:6373232-Alexandrium_andersonii.AAC.1